MSAVLLLVIVSPFDTPLGKLVATSDSNNSTSFTGAVGVRRGSAFGHYRPGPFSFFSFNPVHPDAFDDSSDPSMTRLSIVDEFSDGEAANDSLGNSHPRGYSPFLAGYHWNHHFYCTAADGN